MGEERGLIHLRQQRGEKRMSRLKSNEFVAENRSITSGAQQWFPFNRRRVSLSELSFRVIERASDERLEKVSLQYRQYIGNERKTHPEVLMWLFRAEDAPRLIITGFHP